MRNKRICTLLVNKILEIDEALYWPEVESRETCQDPEAFMKEAETFMYSTQYFELLEYYKFLNQYIK